MATFTAEEPVISVIMPVYNAAKFLRQSIDSVLSQTFKDFEFLIFNDASTDDSLVIIKSYTDPRIKLITSEVNTGYLPHLNHGFKIARGKYIARMDADDISHPERFQQQFDYLEQNTNVQIAGSFITLFSDEKETIKTIKYPVLPKYIKWHAIKGTPLAHPAVMLKTECIAQLNYFYDHHYYPAEDYDLWTRLLLKNYNIANIPAVLLKYRAHQHQTSEVKSELQQSNAAVIKKKYISGLFKVKSSKKIEKIYLFFNRPSLLTFRKFYSIAAYITGKAIITPGVDKKSLLLYIQDTVRKKAIKSFKKRQS